MFGIGGSEIIVILIVALLFLGPDKLPDAAKQISKGIRDLKRGTREIQQTIENDETIGGAIRDLKSALRGEDPPPKPRPKVVAKPPAALPAVEALPAAEPAAQMQLDLPAAEAKPEAPAEAKAEAAAAEAKVEVRLPPEAGEVDPDLREGEHDRAELAAMIRPASGTVAKGAATDETPEPKHG